MTPVGGRKAKLKKLGQGLGVLAVAFLLFALGVAFGQGRLSFGSSNYKPASGNLPAKLDYSSVDQVYQALKDNYYEPLTAQQLLNGLKHGLAEATGDKYTVYFTPQEAKQFNSSLNNTFTGIGAQISQDDNGHVIIQSPLSGYPAEKAGLQARDRILTVNGQSTDGWSVVKAAKEIRGKAGSYVILDILRGNKQLHFQIKRQKITIPSVDYKVMSDNIGYIQIISFSDDTSQLIEQAANQLASKHVKGVILDLRNNPGGELSAAVTAASQWLPDGSMIVSEKHGGQVIDSYRSVGSHPLKDVPTVVLINAGSASAAEITTAALHDNKAAFVIGQTSFGKGVVQQLIDFPGGGKLKVTFAKWYRPNGKNIEHEGITPDKTITPSQSRDAAEAAAIQYLNNH